METIIGLKLERKLKQSRYLIPQFPAIFFLSTKIVAYTEQSYRL